MNYRPLGTTGLSVSELGLGCSAIGSSVFNNLTDTDSINLLKYAFDNGINFYDTASTYTFGNSEKLIGKAFKVCRDKVIISTKVGFLDSSLARYARIISPFISPFRRYIVPHKKKLKKISKKRQDFSKQHILQSIEGSLKRLNTDYVDLYLLHNPSADIISQGDVFETLEKSKEGRKDKILRNFCRKHG
jgi:aryl-alcohol dehydrogenase-like predicted oxidoreductase